MWRCTISIKVPVTLSSSAHGALYNRQATRTHLALWVYVREWRERETIIIRTCTGSYTYDAQVHDLPVTPVLILYLRRSIPHILNELASAWVTLMWRRSFDMLANALKWRSSHNLWRAYCAMRQSITSARAFSIVRTRAAAPEQLHQSSCTYEVSDAFVFVPSLLLKMASRQELVKFTPDELQQFLDQQLDLCAQTLESFGTNRIEGESLLSFARLNFENWWRLWETERNFKSCFHPMLPLSL